MRFSFSFSLLTPPIVGMAPLTPPAYPTVKVHFPEDMRMLPTNESDDPLTRALAPPPNETPEDRAIRVKKEIEAQRVSDQIDETLKQERNALKKRKVVKVLLLGQSESGASPPAHTVVDLSAFAHFHAILPPRQINDPEK